MSKTLIFLTDNGGIGHALSAQDINQSVWESMGYGAKYQDKYAGGDVTRMEIWAIYGFDDRFDDSQTEVKLHEIGGYDYNYCQSMALGYQEMYPGVRIVIRCCTD